jgi:hypothetical protein
MPASKYKFSEQEAYDHAINSASDDATIGCLRVKPSTILWKSKGAKGNKPWFSADLDEFITWIKTKDRKVSK